MGKSGGIGPHSECKPEKGVGVGGIKSHRRARSQLLKQKITADLLLGTVFYPEVTMLKLPSMLRPHDLTHNWSFLLFALWYIIV